jgi:hypothetical protein
MRASSGRDITSINAAQDKRVYGIQPFNDYIVNLNEKRIYLTLEYEKFITREDYKNLLREWGSISE